MYASEKSYPVVGIKISVGVGEGVGVSDGVDDGVDDGLGVQVGGNMGVSVGVGVSDGVIFTRAKRAGSSRSMYASVMKYTGIATAVTNSMAIIIFLPKPRRIRIMPQLACVQIIQQ